MSLKTIRDSYEKLLTTLNEAGIKLDASQKSGLDGFILSLEESVSSQRQKAIKMAKEATEKKMEKEYKEVFESIMKHTQEHYELASKVQDKITQLNESKKLSSKVTNYLDLYLESVCPKKDIVDYAKMKKLEQINESLRDVLLANDDAVIEKKAQLEESFKKEKGKLETEVAKMQVKLNESMEKSQQLKKKLDQYKALELLESKTKDLPTFEAAQVKKQLAEASAPEIEKKFKKVLESVKSEAKKIEEAEETTLESEVLKIVDSEDIEENDMLKGKPHNNHVAESINVNNYWENDDIVTSGGFAKEFNSKDAAVKYALDRIDDLCLAYLNDTRIYASEEDWAEERERVEGENEDAKSAILNTGMASISDGRYTIWQCLIVENNKKWIYFEELTNGDDGPESYDYKSYIKIPDLKTKVKTHLDGNEIWYDDLNESKKEEDFETTETVKFNEDGDVELDDEDVINESTMNRWLRNAMEVI